MNHLVVRRIFSAGLDLQAALGLIGDHMGPSKIYHAIDVLGPGHQRHPGHIFDRGPGDPRSFAR
jgi:hypothetical protein